MRVFPTCAILPTLVHALKNSFSKLWNVGTKIFVMIVTMFRISCTYVILFAVCLAELLQMTNWNSAYSVKVINLVFSTIISKSQIPPTAMPVILTASSKYRGIIRYTNTGTYRVGKQKCISMTCCKEQFGASTELINSISNCVDSLKIYLAF